MPAVAAIARLLTPPLCAACASPCPSRRVLCGGCDARLRDCRPLAGVAPRDVDAIFSSARHDGIARDLVRALKFGRLTSVAALMATRIAAHAPPEILCGELVPVPPAPLRLRRRGFDSAAEVALELSSRSDLPLTECLRRTGSARQVGRSRRKRLAEPPRVRLSGRPPSRAVLVDDVLTTGATLAACARSLRQGGADSVCAVTFARRL